MKIAVRLDSDLFKEAKDLSGIEDKTTLIHEALMALIEKHSREKLIALGGTDKKASALRSRR